MAFSLSRLRNTAAQILAAALVETYPSIQILFVQETSTGFSCDLFFPHAVHPELHHQVEEKMRQIVREKREIREMEMVPFSAREFFKSRGMEVDLPEEGLVKVIQIGSFCHIGFGGYLKNSSEVGAFKIFPVEVLEGEKEIRISGTAYFSKEELKLFLKKRSVYSKVCHEKVGESFSYWIFLNGAVCWLPKGLDLRHLLLSSIKKIMPPSFEVSVPTGVDSTSLFKKWFQEDPSRVVLEIDSFEGNGLDGLFDPGEGTEMRWTGSLEKATSLLQSIAKTLNILGFGYCTRLFGSKRKGRSFRFLVQALEQLQWPYETVLEEGEGAPQIQFLVADGLGRLWSAAVAEVGEFFVCRMMVERNFALLLELQVPLAMNFEERIRRLENQ